MIIVLFVNIPILVSILIKYYNIYFYFIEWFVWWFHSQRISFVLSKSLYTEIYIRSNTQYSNFIKIVLLTLDLIGPLFIVDPQ